MPACSCERGTPTVAEPVTVTRAPELVWPSNTFSHTWQVVEQWTLATSTRLLWSRAVRRIETFGAGGPVTGPAGAERATIRWTGHGGIAPG